jgi:flavin reductase (DIM6/NTAB) family NADH-FMN oxidoreductase RutF
MMSQVKLKNNVFIPMPVTLIGSVVEGRPNFMAVGWVTRANANPPMIAIGIGKTKYTTKGILQSKEFSVCFPSGDLVTKTDYCGIISGAKEDKAKLFTVFYGEQTKAPMIEECPLNLEIKLNQAVELPTNYLFIGEIVGAYSEEKYALDKGLDFKKMNLFFLTMPENIYWAMGDKIGNAWEMGRELTHK